jgi:thiol-disulfide isomerase/thioredoxin
MVAELNAGAFSDQDLIDGLLLDAPRHQLGGEPYLIQPGAGALDCPKCRAELPLLAAVGDDTIDGRGFTGNDYVQVLYFLCTQCAILAAYQTCD